MKVASVDIGTNTCNLLIAEINSNGKVNFLHRQKQAITLINKNDKNTTYISKSSVSNLIDVLNTYKNKITEFQAQKTIITATSGIRSASNQTNILQNIKNRTGLHVEIIEGKREAELVYFGVKKALNTNHKNFLIIDIGGGSIEFIVGNTDKVFFLESYSIGVARLLNQYKFDDPLTQNNIITIQKILAENLSNLLQICKNKNITTLIGSSGSYETFASLIKHEFKLKKLKEDDAYNIIDIKYLEKIHNQLINYNYEQRKNMPGMEIIRVQLIPIASVITQYIIQELNIKTVIQSNYSIKEGLIFDYLSKNKNET